MTLISRNIISFVGISQTASELLFVYEQNNGKSVRDEIEANGMSPTIATRIAKGVAAGDSYPFLY